MKELPLSYAGLHTPDTSALVYKETLRWFVKKLSQAWTEHCSQKQRNSHDGSILQDRPFAPKKDSMTLCDYLFM